MAEEIPNIPIDEVVAADADGVYDPDSTTQTFPQLEDLTTVDSVGPEAANRQPRALDLRTETLRGVVNLLVETVNALEENLLHRDGSAVGSFMRADLSLTDVATSVAYRVTNVADALNDQDAVSKSQLDSLSASVTSLQSQLVDFVRRDGTLAMTANLNMAGTTVENLGVPINAADAVRKDYVDDIFADLETDFLKRDGTLAMLGNLDLNGNKVTDLDLGTPTDDGDGISRVYLLQVLSAIAETPPGSMAFFAGDVSVSGPPAGWLLCSGQAVSRTTYAGLFAVIGVTYGVGDGALTFNLPDFRGRVPMGLDNMGGASANVVTDTAADSLGGTLGAEDVTLTVDQLPAHTHSYLDRYVGAETGGTDLGPNNTNNTSLLSTVAGSTSSIGSDQAHSNVQPSMALNVVVKF